MKKTSILYIALTAATAFMSLSCSREEADLFDKSAAERLNEVADIYTARLKDASNGWVMEYYATNDIINPLGEDNSSYNPASAIGFPIIARFNQDGSVLVAMNNAFSGVRAEGEDNISYIYSPNNYSEQLSYWQVITDNGPVLSFNTYNRLFHIFSDPRSYSVNDLGFGVGSDNDQGVGIGGDYEFIMVDVPEKGEYVMLKGKKRHTYVRMTRLEADVNYEEYLKDLSDFQNRLFPQSAPNYNVLTVNGDQFKVDQMYTTVANIYSNDRIADESYHPYMITKHNGKYYLRFREEFTYFDKQTEQTVKYGAQEFVYDEALQMFVDVKNSKNTFAGVDPCKFAFEVINKGEWTMSRNNGTGALNDAYLSVYNASKKIKYTLNGVYLTKYDGDYVVKCSLKATTTTNVYYKFNIALEGDKLVMQYVEPLNATAGNVLNALPEMQNLLDALSGSFTVECSESPFNLSRVVIRNANDSESSYTVSCSLK